MTDQELEAIRVYAERHGVKPWTEHIFTLLAEVFRLRALVGEPEWEYAGDHGDGSRCVAESLDEVLLSHDRSLAVRRRVSPWEPVPETGDDRG